MATIKPNISFDKLDKKCIQELPLMIDVIASTYNKIKLLFDSFYDDMKDELKNEIKKKSKWHLSKREHPIIFYPFTKEEYTNTTKIKSLKNYFGLAGAFNFYSGGYAYKNRSASLWVYVSHYFDIEVDNSSARTEFCIENPDFERFGILYKPNFYSKIRDSIIHKSLYPYYYNPSDGEDPEQVGIFCNELDVENITLTYKTFKEKMLIPFIRHLK